MPVPVKDANLVKIPKHVTIVIGVAALVAKETLMSMMVLFVIGQYIAIGTALMQLMRNCMTHFVMLCCRFHHGCHYFQANSSEDIVAHQQVQQITM